MVKIQIFTTLWWKFRFTPHLHHANSPYHGENSDLHHAVVKIQIFMTFTPHHGENSDLHHAVVKIQIFMTFTPCHGENSDFHDIYTTPW